MAAPGYPQQPPMGGPPMGGPPMGGPPMGGPPMGGPPTGMRPMKRGTSKAVPIVVSAGLAVGVFCGLLFGVGKKSEAVAAAPATSEDKAPAKASNAKAETAPTPAPEAKPEPAAAGSATVAAAGSAAPTAPPAAATVPTTPTVPPPAAPTPAVVEHKTTKIIVVIKTDAAAKDAKLIVDGKPVEGLSAEIPTENKVAKVEVKSSGFRSYEKKLDLTPGELTLEIEMAKRPAAPAAPAGGSVKPPKKDKPPAGGGGLIDI